MTTIEARHIIAQNCGFTNWNDLVGQCDSIYEYIDKAMKLYAQQFIDAANQIIEPATEILPDTYDKDYEKWYDTILINKDENNS